MEHPQVERVHDTWVHSDRPVPVRFVRPLLQFTRVAASGGIVLIIAAIAALVWANAPFGETYDRFWNNHLNIELGAFHFDESLKELVNDGLMAIFFFVVGLEIKRELVVGDLADRRSATLPAIAALGGMVVPALIFVLFVIGAGGEASRGWGIPMATDIAFSLGVASLLGSRVSVQAKLFLLALAIADDIGAIAVIAIFYTSDLSLTWLGLAILSLVVIWVAQRVGIRSLAVYLILALAVWFFTLESGVHATLAGVAVAFLTPIRPFYSDSEYYRRTKWIVDQYELDSHAPRRRERVDFNALQLAKVANESVSPLDRAEVAITPWSSFVILPLFALANAGVRFVGLDVGEAVTSPVALGVAIGLIVGKTVGVTGATYLGVRSGLGRLPAGTTWTHILGLASLAGIGFTVSLFITELAFTDEALLTAAKLGIFIGSGVAGLVGYVALRTAKAPSSPPPADDDLEDAVAAT
jgi:NhaA family Na+:H+ antiporter